MKRPRLLLGDDHRMFLDGLHLSLVCRFDVVAAVTDGEAVIEAAHTHRPDAIVLDLAMPFPNGLEVSRELLASDSSWRIILLTMHSDPHLAAAALELGVVGYCMKTETIDELERAIFKVLEGRRSISPAIDRARLDDLLARRDVENLPATFQLTSRQKEVLSLIAEGLACKEIAAKLGVSMKTVEFHKYSMMERLEIRSSAGLVRYAGKLGLVPT